MNFLLNFSLLWKFLYLFIILRFINILRTYQYYHVHGWMCKYNFCINTTVQFDGYRKTEDPSRPCMVIIYIQKGVNRIGLWNFHLYLPSFQVLHRAQLFYVIKFLAIVFSIQILRKALLESYFWKYYVYKDLFVYKWDSSLIH